MKTRGVNLFLSFAILLGIPTGSFSQTNSQLHAMTDAQIVALVEQPNLSPIPKIAPPIRKPSRFRLVCYLSNRDGTGRLDESSFTVYLFPKNESFEFLRWASSEFFEPIESLYEIKARLIEISPDRKRDLRFINNEIRKRLKAFKERIPSNVTRLQNYTGEIKGIVGFEPPWVIVAIDSQATELLYLKVVDESHIVGTDFNVTVVRPFYNILHHSER
jgi:hypothetical protein